MAGLTVEQMQFLSDKGLSLADAIEFARMFEKPRSANAERQARYRARKNDSGNVTHNVTHNADSNVTPSLSLPPNEINSNPPTHTHPDNKPGREEKTGTPAKPDEVKAQTWADFVDLRKRKRAPITETAMAGIRREAVKAGWALEDALAETVTRGWQSFKAEFVEEKRPPPGRSGDPSSHLDYLLSKQSAGASR